MRRDTKSNFESIHMASVQSQYMFLSILTPFQA